MEEDFEQYAVKTSPSEDEFSQYAVSEKSDITVEPVKQNSGSDLKPSITDLIRKSAESASTPEAIFKRHFPLQAIEQEANTMYSATKESILDKPFFQKMVSGLSDKPIIKMPELVKDKLDIGDISPRSIGRTAQSMAIDTAIQSLAGSGVKIQSLSRDFLETKPFASTKDLSRELINTSNSLYKNVAKLLQPKDLAKYLEKDSNHPAVLELSSIIKKAKTPSETKAAIKTEINKLFSERKELLAKNNQPMKPTHIAELKSVIDSREASKLVTPEQLKGMRDVFNEEVSAINEIPAFDRLTAEARKEFYQGLARRVYENGIDERTSGKLEAQAILARGLKKISSKDLPRVDEINSKYEGLLKGVKLVSNLEAKMLKEPSKTLERIAFATGRLSGQSVIAAAIRELPSVRRSFDYGAQTSKIGKLANKADAVRTILENRIKSASKR